MLLASKSMNVYVCVCGGGGGVPLHRSESNFCTQSRAGPTGTSNLSSDRSRQRCDISAVNFAHTSNTVHGS